MSKKNVKNHKLEEYKQNVKRRLEKLTPIFQKIAMGDFSSKIELPGKEDEFTPLIVSLSVILDDLRLLDKENKQKTEELEAAKADLEKKVELRTKELKELNKKLEEKVRERTQELKRKVVELEKFNRVAVGREVKMVELKKEIKRYKEKLVKPET